ncbi:polysaccharide deacetylase [Legionella lansingensis]|uniref:Polysaccharide deacetylase n=1 Tax=Legionella lansingensis TaxID=45067 RepID=A0A0W0VQ62_9GAMM|nr:polysaccharide deacetylase family protein [Legionella lansingensis]KTD22270.1 polysaccharide deacetylase [Legionella lansingensis]SNV50603.1 polysaccharide deacetylase [Legionella lansingensis]
MLKKCILCLTLACLSSHLAFAQDREIAITIDDLPFVGSSNGNAGKLKRERERFLKILQTLIDKKVPATGFVIAGSIEQGQWELLEQFREAGFLLGNHTYSHKSLNSITAEKYIDDVDKADKILTPLFPKHKYFRYPYLAESSGEKRQKVYDYLAAHHYIIAPVTVDSKDFVFNQQLFAIPYRLREQNLNQLRKRYLAFIWNQTLKAESKAAKLNPDKPVKHILLIHANLLNSHFLGDIIDLYRQNGYRIVSLEEALTAPAESINATEVNEKYEMLFEDSVLKAIFNQQRNSP